MAPMFPYFGAKHGLASTYPRPRYDTIVEPFAGAAGYSTHWANGHTVIVNDIDQGVLSSWQMLQTLTVEEIRDYLTVEAAKDRTFEPMIAATGGSSAWAMTRTGTDRAVTPRMRKDVPGTIARIERALAKPTVWQLREGSYLDLPDIEATWFIDPPYQPLASMAGDGYVHGASGIDYDELADWCQSRRGQVIVCEQSPAEWLPFTDHRNQHNGDHTGGKRRLEVVWYSDQQQLGLFNQ